MPERDLNTALIKQTLVKGAKEGLDRAARKALARAQKHAPVRKLFRGSTSTISHGYRVPKQHRIQTTRKVPIPGFDDEPVKITGHANSMIPVFRTGNVLFTGDFRRVGSEPGTLARVEGTSVRRTAGRDMKMGRQQTSGGRLVNRKGQQLLTSRGKFEVRSGRANFADMSDEGRGKMRVGGRLRGELYVVDAVLDGDHIWAYVVSPTKDPETGYPYNRAQEFGSRHNRAHPFLRPALRESAGDLVTEVRRNVKVGPQA